tara:strand:- start:3491 stop:3637 length:147 start_codon:yes stop_codon:yes gene_type:complete
MKTSTSIELSEKEREFLKELWNDIYYAINVHDMTLEGQKLFISIGDKL